VKKRESYHMVKWWRH